MINIKTHCEIQGESALIELSGSGTAHPRADDARCEDDDLRSYPKLSEVVAKDQRLDTTYARPEHDSRAQDEVAEKLSEQTKSLFVNAVRSNKRPWVLLSYQLRTRRGGWWSHYELNG